MFKVNTDNMDVDEELYKRYYTKHDASHLGSIWRAPPPSEENFAHLVDSQLCKDSEFLHIPTGVTLPIHRFVLNESIQTLCEIGISCESIDSVVTLVENLQVSASTIVDLWHLLYGKSIFVSMRCMMDYNNERCVGDAISALVPQINLMSAIRKMGAPTDSGWIADYYAHHLTIAVSSLFYNALKSSNEEGSISWDEDVATSIQSVLNCLFDADRDLTEASLLVLRELYNLAFLLFPTDVHSCREIRSWFRNICSGDDEKFIFIISKPFILTYREVNLKFKSFFTWYLNKLTLFEPNQIFERRLTILHFSFKLHLQTQLQEKAICGYKVTGIGIDVPPPNMAISIDGIDHTYHVHDFIISRWIFFQNMISSCMTESVSGVICLPARFSPQILQCILAILYHVPMSPSKSCPAGSIYYELSYDDCSFAVNNAQEFYLVPFSVDSEIPKDDISQRFFALMQYCYKMTLTRVGYGDTDIVYIFNPKTNSQAPPITSYDSDNSDGCPGYDTGGAQDVEDVD